MNRFLFNVLAAITAAILCVVLSIFYCLKFEQAPPAVIALVLVSVWLCVDVYRYEKERIVFESKLNGGV